MEPVAATAEDSSLVFEFPSPKEMRPPLITLDSAAVGYVRNLPVLSELGLRIDPDDRIALIGQNGNGKTTLARLLAGQLEAMGGSVVASPRLRIGYFAQHQIDELVLDETPFQHMTRLMPEEKPIRVRAHLGRFGFSGDKALVQVGRLSGGERSRLALALITRDAPHILILDEPTNHLDVDAREALVQALNGYGGAVVVVSHDRHLLELIADRLVLVADGTAREYEGTLDDYRDLVLASTGSSRIDARPAKRVSRKEIRRQAELEHRVSESAARAIGCVTGASC